MGKISGPDVYRCDWHECQVEARTERDRGAPPGWATGVVTAPKETISRGVQALLCPEHARQLRIFLGGSL